MCLNVGHSCICNEEPVTAMVDNDGGNNTWALTTNLAATRWKCCGKKLRNTRVMQCGDANAVNFKEIEEDNEAEYNENLQQAKVDTWSEQNTFYINYKPNKL